MRTSSGVSLSNSHAKFLQHTNTLLLVFLSGHPEVVFVFHDVCENGATQEHHMLSARWVFDADLKFLKEKDKIVNCHKRITRLSAL